MGKRAKQLKRERKQQGQNLMTDLPSNPRQRFVHLVWGLDPVQDEEELLGVYSTLARAQSIATEVNKNLMNPYQAFTDTVAVDEDPIYPPSVESGLTSPFQTQDEI
jgi:hypothetical protein